MSWGTLYVHDFSFVLLKQTFKIVYNFKKALVFVEKKKEESKHKKKFQGLGNTHTTQMVLKIVPCNLEKSHSEWGNAVSVLT